jgi:hypothetical protein
MTVAETKSYRLLSSEFVGAPGVIAWAKNGYAFPKDRPQLLNVVVSTWSVPEAAAEKLLLGEVDYTVDEDGAVVFEA